MPFLRFSRDKRGYENTYLVHAPNRRGKPSRPRVLYWYRTPPGIRVGRPPFDEEVRRKLEAQNPDVTFDWPAIVSTPFPPPAENEQWRERRRAERAAKQAQRAEEQPAEQDNQVTDVESGPGTLAEKPAQTDDDIQLSSAESLTPAEASAPSSEAIAPPVNPDALRETRRRRRRRGGRRRRGPGQTGPVPGAPEGGPEEPADLPGGSSEPFEPPEPLKSVDRDEE